MELVKENFATLSPNHERSSDSPVGLRISYGTAGFRDKAHLLDPIMFRVGIAAGLRSKFMSGKAIGLMVTASHNPEEDNGVKIIDPMGEMMDSSWESWITEFVNLKGEEGEEEGEVVMRFVEDFVKKNSIDLDTEAVVLVGRDTRESSVKLAESAMDGVKVMNGVKVMDGVKVVNGRITDFGLLTTPQLHFLVRCSNDPSYGVPTEFSYYYKLSQAFLSLNGDGSDPEGSKYQPSVVIDCANGVGSLKMTQMMGFINTHLDVRFVNSGEGTLNHNCGADFVKLNRKAPSGMDREMPSGMDRETPSGMDRKIPSGMDRETPSGMDRETSSGMELKRGERAASFDGDADRLVYFFIDDSFHLLDGDKIAILYVHYLKLLLTQSGVYGDLSLRMIQTAYANGSSTRYCEEELGVKTDCVPTGVKHLHSRAKDFDISVYFEANGHGTVLFSDKAAEVINTIANEEVEDGDSSGGCVKGDGIKSGESGGIKSGKSDGIKSGKSVGAGKKLSFIMNLINQTTGDAIADLLLVESILRNMGWSVKDWNDLYQDLPSRQIKVKVVDRNLVTTCNAERTCVTPTGLQDAIDAHVRKAGEMSRCFIRPSGTEDIVRVYAESSTQEKADQLASAVADAVREIVDQDYGDK